MLCHSLPCLVLGEKGQNWNVKQTGDCIKLPLPPELSIMRPDEEVQQVWVLCPIFPLHTYAVGSGASTSLDGPHTAPEANDAMPLQDRARSLPLLLCLRFSLGLWLSSICLTLCTIFFSLAHISVIPALAFLCFSSSPFIFCFHRSPSS